MIKKNQTKKGFSILEVVLVVGILSIALGFSLLYTQTSQVRSDLNTQTTMLVSNLRLAQSNAISGHTSQPVGVHLSSSSYVLFLGDVYNPNSVSNYTVNLPPTITIQNITLNGGGNDIVFTVPDGDPLKSGSFTLRSDQINKSNTITISSLGTVNY